VERSTPDFGAAAQWLAAEVVGWGGALAWETSPWHLRAASGERPCHQAASGPMVRSWKVTSEWVVDCQRVKQRSVDR